MVVPGCAWHTYDEAVPKPAQYWLQVCIWRCDSCSDPSPYLSIADFVTCISVCCLEMWWNSVTAVTLACQSTKDITQDAVLQSRCQQDGRFGEVGWA